MALVPDFQSDLTNHFFKGFKISSHFIDDKAKEIHFYLEPCSEFPVCPRCKGKNVVVHEYRKRVVQDDSFWGIRLFYLLPIEPLNVSSVINIPLKKYLLI